MYNHLALVEHPATQIIKPLATYRASLPALHYLQKSLGEDADVMLAVFLWTNSGIPNVVRCSLL